jgi:hypothetical protein
LNRKILQLLAGRSSLICPPAQLFRCLMLSVIQVVPLISNAKEAHVPRDLSKAQALAIHQLIDASECTFNPPPSLIRQKTTPVIVRVSVPCGDGKPSLVHECYGTIYCTNNVSPFYIEKAVCWSPDGSRCHSANACAKSSFFDSV